MKFVEEFRDGRKARALAGAIHRKLTRPWTLMEVCGGQTHAIVRFGLDELLPKELTLVHGPGCPVCVTPVAIIDQALAIAARPEVTFCSFGDMLRVPGSAEDLFSVKSRGGDVRIVYSPLDAVALARELPERQVVFFAVGFETTAPGNALAMAGAGSAAEWLRLWLAQPEHDGEKLFTCRELDDVALRDEAWKTPGAPATDRAAKTSVTALRRQAAEETEDEA